MKVYKKQFSAKDLLEVANDPSMRVGSTPFGAPEGEMTMYIGRSVPWKGVKGMEAVRAANPRVAAGLEKARAISMSHREPGIAVVQYPNGQVVTMPMKCYRMMEDVGHVVTLVRATGVSKRPWVTKRVRIPA